MRYRYEEYSPQNKKQYVIAVGVHELRAVYDAIDRVLALSPSRTQEQRDYRTALQTSKKGFAEAIKLAEVNEDEGKRRRPYIGESQA